MNGFKFPRQRRLLTKAAYNEVFSRPKSSADQFFKVLAKPNQQAYPRLGLAVSRRVDKTAVGRNRLKRIIREFFRHTRASDDSSDNLDYVVMPRMAARQASSQQLLYSLRRHWKRLR